MRDSIEVDTLANQVASCTGYNIATISSTGVEPLSANASKLLFKASHSVLVFRQVAVPSFWILEEACPKCFDGLYWNPGDPVKCSSYAFSDSCYYSEKERELITTGFHFEDSSEIELAGNNFKKNFRPFLEARGSDALETIAAGEFLWELLLFFGRNSYESYCSQHYS